MELVKKEKSGYYITVNFYQKCLILLRFGWIDHSDWKAQKSETGQAAGLDKKVYEYKLIQIPGDYRLNAPVGILRGIGKKTIPILYEEEILSILDLKNYQGNNSIIINLKQKLNLDEYL